MLTQHLLDSLAVVAPLRRQTGGRPVRLLDVGSGAGLPGVVIAICCPELQVDCVDTVGKKAAFIQQAAGQLQLPNLRGVHARVENLAGPYDVISSRAFASLADFVDLVAGGAGGAGRLDGHEGQAARRRDRRAAADGWKCFTWNSSSVPGLDAERCIVWMRRAPRPVT